MTENDRYQLEYLKSIAARRRARDRDLQLLILVVAICFASAFVIASVARAELVCTENTYTEDGTVHEITTCSGTRDQWAETFSSQPFIAWADDGTFQTVEVSPEPQVFRASTRSTGGGCKPLVEHSLRNGERIEIKGDGGCVTDRVRCATCPECNPASGFSITVAEGLTLDPGRYRVLFGGSRAFFDVTGPMDRCDDPRGCVYRIARLGDTPKPECGGATPKAFTVREVTTQGGPGYWKQTLEAEVYFQGPSTTPGGIPVQREPWKKGILACYQAEAWP